MEVGYVRRMLTTHAGSLPRPAALIELLASLSRGEDVDDDLLVTQVDAAVAEVVSLQHDVGIDIGNDGEQGRESFFTYVQHRMTGYAPGGARSRIFQDMWDFPDFIDMFRGQAGPGSAVSLGRPPQAVSAVAYADPSAIDREVQTLMRHQAERPFADAFMTAPSPGIIVAAMANQHYDSQAEYLTAVGEALAVEYRRIVEAGLLLQIDAPDLAMECHCLYRDRPVEEFLDFVTTVVETMNEALAGLASERVRLHVCWGNYDGPHTRDIPLAELLGRLYEANVGGLLLSGANPRHEHEYKEFTRQPLPAGWSLAAGVIDTTTNYVEHPEVVADRLGRVAEAVGDPDRVIASTDCGFDTAAGFRAVAPDIAWAKLRALRDGADLAASR